MKGPLVPKIIVSAVAGALLVARIVWPEWKIDMVTLGLLALGILPWVSELIKSARFPGGWKIQFRDIKEAGDKVTSGEGLSGNPEGGSASAPYKLFDGDANLALVGFRIDVERRLRALAEKQGIRADQPLLKLTEELHQVGVLSALAASGLRELISAGDQAAHGTTVEPSVSQWALENGPLILKLLDSKL